jgi:hypothetical protein
VISFDEQKLRIFAAIERVTPQMLEDIWRETEYRLDILRATKGTHVVVVLYSAALILQTIKLFEFTCIFHKQFHLVISGLKIIDHVNPDNNLESPRICCRA